MPRKAATRKVKGVSRNKKQVIAAEVRAAATELAELASKRKRSSGEGGNSPKRTKHVPQKVGRGGFREKLDVDKLDSPSRKQIERKRRNGAAHRLRQGVSEVSEAVRADPTEAWRTKATGGTLTRILIERVSVLPPSSPQRFRRIRCFTARLLRHPLGCRTRWASGRQRRWTSRRRKMQ